MAVRSTWCSPDERLGIRQRESAPLIERLFAWVEAQRLVVPEHAPLREGLVYLHNQGEALCELLSNGEQAGIVLEMSRSVVILEDLGGSDFLGFQS
ncbi:IS66 family transposase [Sorangium sp. So ce887]|uniref:IS66 family transposase n=1 Tax=Sorangium sp. So ce887 TaxID=3133324 RepID=UPI003F5E9C58